MRALGFTVGMLTLASVAGSLSTHYLSVGDDLWRQVRDSYHRLFYLDSEANIPTWYQSSALLFCAALLGVIAFAKGQERDRFARHWAMLSAIFVGLSLDEEAMFHEMAIELLRPLFDTSGLLYYTWVVPGAAAVCLFALAYLRFLFHLPPKTRVLLAISGAVYVGGAVGMEAISGQHAARFGEGDMTYHLISTAEELMEMTGVVVLICALLGYAGQHLGELTLRFNGAEPRQPPEPVHAAQRHDLAESMR